MGLAWFTYKNLSLPPLLFPSYNSAILIVCPPVEEAPTNGKNGHANGHTNVISVSESDGKGKLKAHSLILKYY